MPDCQHPPEAIHPGPRIPLAYGSAPSDVCTICGAYRTTHHITGQWQAGPPDLSPRED